MSRLRCRLKKLIPFRRGTIPKEKVPTAWRRDNLPAENRESASSSVFAKASQEIEDEAFVCKLLAFLVVNDTGLKSGQYCLKSLAMV